MSTFHVHAADCRPKSSHMQAKVLMQGSGKPLHSWLSLRVFRLLDVVVRDGRERRWLERLDSACLGFGMCAWCWERVHRVDGPLGMGRVCMVHMVEGCGTTAGVASLNCILLLLLGKGRQLVNTVWSNLAYNPRRTLFCRCQWQYQCVCFVSIQDAGMFAPHLLHLPHLTHIS